MSRRSTPRMHNLRVRPLKSLNAGTGIVQIAAVEGAALEFLINKVATGTARACTKARQVTAPPSGTSELYRAGAADLFNYLVLTMFVFRESYNEPLKEVMG